MGGVQIMVSDSVARHWRDKMQQREQRPPRSQHRNERQHNQYNPQASSAPVQAPPTPDMTSEPIPTENPIEAEVPAEKEEVNDEINTVREPVFKLQEIQDGEPEEELRKRNEYLTLREDEQASFEKKLQNWVEKEEPELRKQEESLLAMVKEKLHNLENNVELFKN